MTEPTPEYIADLIKETERKEANARRSAGHDYGQLIAAFYHGLVSEGVPPQHAMQLTGTYIHANAANPRGGNQ